MPKLPPDKSAALQEKLEWLKEHIHLPPQEALELAQKRWPDIRLQRIHALRHILKSQGVKVLKAKPGGIHPRVAVKVKKRRPGGMSEATKFILAQPPDMPRGEVAALATKAGLSIDIKAVSGTRSRHKDLLAAGAASPVTRPAEPAQLALPAPEVAAPAKRKYTRKEPVVLPLGTLSTDEADFMGLILGIGYNRATRLLAQFRQQFFAQLKDHSTDND